MTTPNKGININNMQNTAQFLYSQADLYTKLLRTTSELIQILNDNDEDTGDLPVFYERIQKRAYKCVQQIDEALEE